MFCMNRTLDFAARSESEPRHNQEVATLGLVRPVGLQVKTLGRVTRERLRLEVRRRVHHGELGDSLAMGGLPRGAPRPRRVVVHNNGMDRPRLRRSRRHPLSVQLGVAEMVMEEHQAEETEGRLGLRPRQEVQVDQVEAQEDPEEVQVVVLMVDRKETILGRTVTR